MACDGLLAMVLNECGGVGVPPDFQPFWIVKDWHLHMMWNHIWIYPLSRPPSGVVYEPWELQAQPGRCLGKSLHVRTSVPFVDEYLYIHSFSGAFISQRESNALRDSGLRTL